jgi:cell wall-associated NlpC family hydrolase
MPPVPSPTVAHPMKIALLLFALLLVPPVCLAEEDAQPAFVQQEGAPAVQEDEALNDLAFYALSLTGTPYRYGGNSPETGFDCSGFVRHVFHSTLGIELPRSSREIKELGERITPNELRPGDLVFYNTLRRAFSHVGIYLGEGRFVHSPSSGGGIRVEDMSQGYWQKRFNGARRIISSSR